MQLGRGCGEEARMQIGIEKGREGFSKACSGSSKEEAIAQAANTLYTLFSLNLFSNCMGQDYSPQFIDEEPKWTLLFQNLMDSKPRALKHCQSNTGPSGLPWGHLPPSKVALGSDLSMDLGTNTSCLLSGEDGAQGKRRGVGQIHLEKSVQTSLVGRDHAF